MDDEWGHLKDPTSQSLALAQGRTMKNVFWPAGKCKCHHYDGSWSRLLQFGSFVPDLLLLRGPFGPEQLHQSTKIFIYL